MLAKNKRKTGKKLANKVNVDMNLISESLAANDVDHDWNGIGRLYDVLQHVHLELGIARLTR